MGTTEQLLRSWREAADDLGLKVEEFGDAVVVRSFGSPRGMLCAIRQAPAEVRELQDEAESRGMGWSALSESYLRYDRTLFIDTLDDWGWCSENAAPSWYSGRGRSVLHFDQSNTLLRGSGVRRELACRWWHDVGANALG